MTLIKICGITRPEDARAAVIAGADWLGLNFWPGSKRHVDRTSAARVARAARRAAAEAARTVTVVGVYVNQAAAEMASIAGDIGLDRIQLHGDESAELCARMAGEGLAVIKALAMAEPADVARIAHYPCDVFLIDTPSTGYGGSGRTFDWDLARTAVAQADRLGRHIILAGGLDPHNVANAVAGVRPYGVDVASGVESAPGIKDPEKTRAFIAQARAVAGPAGPD